MLQTLINIGKEISKGRDEWNDIIYTPAISNEKGFRLYAAEMLFDIDENAIVFDANSLREYSEEIIKRRVR